MRMQTEPRLDPGISLIRLQLQVLLVWLGLALMVSSVCRADDPADTPPDSKPQVLLLRNGAILRGKILSRGEDYLMQAPHGQVVVPGILVRAACRDLQEAFEIMQERAAAQSEGSAYVTLAKWCQSVQMFEEAHASLELALNLDANLDEARRLLTLNTELRQEHRRSLQPLEAAEPTPAERGDSESHLGGLPKTLAGQFTSRIQPILTNNCSTASCHGPRSETGFRLERVPVGQRSERGAVERNLQEVSKYLDVHQPAHSPLLTRAKQPHGKPGRTLWTGASGKQQLAELQAWVREASPYLQGSPADPPKLVESSPRGKSRPVDAPQDPQVVLAAAEQELQAEEKSPQLSSSNENPAAGVPEIQPPARLPPAGRKIDAAREGTRSRPAQGRSKPQANPRMPPSRLQPRPSEPLDGVPKSPTKSASAKPPLTEATGQDLFDPAEFNRARQRPVD